MRTEVNLYVTCPSCKEEFALPQAVSGTKIRSASDLVPLIAHFGHDEKETFRVVYLNNRNVVMGIETIASGAVNGVSMRVGEVFRETIKSNAAAIIIVHNHPSGDTTASMQDLTLTSEIQEAGKILQVPLVDHIILGRNGEYLSFKNEGMLNDR